MLSPTWANIDASSMTEYISRSSVIESPIKAQFLKYSLSAGVISLAITVGITVVLTVVLLVVLPVEEDAAVLETLAADEVIDEDSLEEDDGLFVSRFFSHDIKNIDKKNIIAISIPEKRLYFDLPAENFDLMKSITPHFPNFN